MGADRHIDLVKLELQELTDSVIDPSAEQAFGLYAWESGHAGAELGRHIERVVFQEYFGNSPELMAAEYAAYEPASVFFCVVDHRRRLPAGVMRVIRPGERGFKSLHDMERGWERSLDDVLARTRLSLDPDRVWDVATLAVDAEYRGDKTNGLISLALYQALATAALRAGVGWWVTILDVVVLDLLQTQTQRPFSYFHGVAPKRYLDSPSSVPVWCDIPKWERRLGALDPAMHEIICQGRGLEAAVTPLELDSLFTAAATAPAGGVVTTLG